MIVTKSEAEAIDKMENVTKNLNYHLTFVNKYTEELKLLKKDVNLSPFKITRAK